MRLLLVLVASCIVPQMSLNPVPHRSSLVGAQSLLVLRSLWSEHDSLGAFRLDYS
jgi:hypothetical protein